MTGRPWVPIMLLLVITAVLLTFRDLVSTVLVAITYLVLVQWASARHGRALGLTIAALAFLEFDWFFVEPRGTLLVAKWGDVLVLCAFLAASILAGHLFERVRALAQAAEHAESLRETGRMKDAVLASVSHDLRTPLTTIKALAHDIAASDERALTIEEEADRLESLVGNLLDLSTLSGGGMALNLEPNEAEDLVGAALQRVAGPAKGREIQVLLVEGDPLLFGRFDFSQTLRVVCNLLENALKYSPPDSAIELAVRREGESLAFAVADRGIGVLKEDRERIFEPFYRSRRDAVPDVGGAGLGLSIARALAAAQGGSLGYEPREGGGSVFILRVPYVQV